MLQATVDHSSFRARFCSWVRKGSHTRAARRLSNSAGKGFASLWDNPESTRPGTRMILSRNMSGGHQQPPPYQLESRILADQAQPKDVFEQEATKTPLHRGARYHRRNKTLCLGVNSQLKPPRHRHALAAGIMARRSFQRIYLSGHDRGCGKNADRQRLDKS